jgi:hypothetical protein
MLRYITDLLEPDTGVADLFGGLLASINTEENIYLLTINATDEDNRFSPRCALVEEIGLLEVKRRFGEEDYKPHALAYAKQSRTIKRLVQEGAELEKIPVEAVIQEYYKRNLGKAPEVKGRTLLL